MRLLKERRHGYCGAMSRAQPTSCDDSLVMGTGREPLMPPMRKASIAADDEPNERVTVVCSPGAPLTDARVLEMMA